MVNRCEHEWRWLEAVHVTIDRDGRRTDYRNVECTRCGCRAWKHGRAPNAPAIVAFASPTTRGATSYAATEPRGA